MSSFPGLWRCRCPAASVRWTNSRKHLRRCIQSTSLSWRLSHNSWIYRVTFVLSCFRHTECGNDICHVGLNEALKRLGRSERWVPHIGFHDLERSQISLSVSLKPGRHLRTDVRQVQSWHAIFWLMKVLVWSVNVCFWSVHGIGSSVDFSTSENPSAYYPASRLELSEQWVESPDDLHEDFNVSVNKFVQTIR
jgi:hypothetical protein